MSTPASTATLTASITRQESRQEFCRARRLTRVSRCRPGQASQRVARMRARDRLRERGPGPITIDVGIAPRRELLFVLQQAFVVMDPRLRGDDNRRDTTTK